MRRSPTNIEHRINGVTTTKSKLLVFFSSKVIGSTNPELGDQALAEVAVGGVLNHREVAPRPSRPPFTGGDSILLVVHQARVKPLDKKAKDT